MPQANEPGTTGNIENIEENNAPGDKLPPRRRRRAASRPAGPPVTETQDVDAPAITAVDVMVTDIATAETDSTPEPEAAPARPRRRAVRKATSPAGSPKAVEPVEIVEAQVEEVAEAAPEVVEAAPARPRRRAVRKATSPAGSPKAVEPVEIVEAVENGESVEEAAAVAVAEPAPAAAPRGRTRRRASAPAGSPQTAEAVAEPGSVEEPVAVTDTSSADNVPEAEEEAETEPQAEAAPPARTRRRAVRKATAPAGAPKATGAAADTAESLSEPVAAATAAETAARTEPAAEAPAAEAEDAAPHGRRRRRVTASAGRPEFTGKDEEPVRKSRRATRPAVAVFQAPVFTEPMFQTPESAAAAAAASRHAEIEAEEEAGTVEEQPAAEAAPSAGSRRRRRRRGEAVEPEQTAPVAEEPVEEEHEPEPQDAGDAEHEAEVEGEGEGEETDEYGDRPTRRRRRGGRRRRRGENHEGEETPEQHGEEAAAADQAEDEREQAQETEAEEEEHETAASGTSSSRRRRRRRRRSGDLAADVEVGADDPERTVVKVREPRKKEEREPGTGFDEVQSIKGSTRMEAKKQRRREGREQGRRRVPIITEAEFLARREAVERVMVVRQNGERTQIGVLEDNVLVEHYVNKEQATSYVGNVYLGKVQNVLPSMEAAFVDIGKGRNAVLYAGEVNFEALGMAHGPRRIETALKSGQSVLVQVTKDPIGHKGARLTSQVSLPGRYLVYVPEGSMTGISRKLPDTERARLKTILKKIVPEDAGVIVRTAAEGASEDELRRDVERLQQQWDDIQKKAKGTSGSSAPTLLYGEPDMTVRVVRDIFNEDFSKVIVSGDDAWETIHGYVSQVAPDLTERLSRWTSEVDIFATYRIDEQLMKALDRKVYLPSGGSLVIDKTEAMVVVDVNTGKFTGQGGNLEETVTKNNLEAAEEIVRQLRLRDLGGIVVVDFIDMVLESNRDLVLRRLLECLGRDRTKHQVAEVTSLGLVQMTRKRVGQGLLESFSEACVHCNGRGVIVHMPQPASIGGGNGKRSKKRGRGGAVHEHEHGPEHVTEAPAEAAAEAAVGTGTAAEIETVAEVAAEVAAPVALPEPEFAPDEELYSSAAEAEAAAARGRGRRRTTRKATAPAGAPKAAKAPAAPVAEPEPEPAVVVEAGPVAEPEPVAEAPVAAEAPAAEAPKGRTRRRATRKATAPAGSPASAEPVEEVMTVLTPADAEASAAEAAQPEVVVVEAVAEPAPPRARRRVTRKVTAPAGSPAGADAAEVVVVTGSVVAEPEAVPAVSEEPATVPAEALESAAEISDGEAPEAEAPAKKTARKAVKKATAKKAATKKTAAKKTTTAKKTAAKKTVAKKTTAKKTTAKKATAKKTVAAEQSSQPSVSADTES
ncbi:Rne/Rng family ribonuclease [Streptomyces sp. NPDC057545]|uniref:Rne/Rng family ribonuclease n=1 Tax=Streptomyces sp. NPDC057545 TaxID=3346164 RepID=UPI0036895CA4